MQSRSLSFGKEVAMALKSTPTRYGSVAVAIHWSSALAVILTWLAGFAVANVMTPAQQGPIFIAHITLGTIVLLLTLLRILWWLAADRHPGAPADQPAWQVRTAQLVHLGLYLLLILMASSGITTLILSGAVPAILGGGPVPDFPELVPRIAHGVMAKIILALFVVHAGAALYHQFIRGDHLLARMGVGRV
jgi:cytochrome b561